MNIVVLAGGLSTERDVSISSGSMIAKALRSKGHKVVLLDVFMGYENENCDVKSLFEQNYDFTGEYSVKESVPDLESVKKLRKDKSSRFLGTNVEEICKYADICFLALHGGEGENGKLQATFDLLGIKYTGSGYLGSAVAMDKGITKSLFLSGNVPTAKSFLLKKSDFNVNAVSFGNEFPCVVKPCSGGSSVGVSIVQDKADFLKAVNESFKYEDNVLVEQYIKGREFSIGVLDSKALPIIEIIPNNGFYDYVNKYQSGKTQEICPAKLDSETTKRLQVEAEKAFKVLQLEGYARIDFLLSEENEIYCLEANTLPGMTPISLLPQEAQAQGIDFASLCEKIVEISLKKYN